MKRAGKRASSVTCDAPLGCSSVFRSFSHPSAIDEQLAAAGWTIEIRGARYKVRKDYCPTHRPIGPMERQRM